MYEENNIFSCIHFKNMSDSVVLMEMGEDFVGEDFENISQDYSAKLLHVTIR